MFKAIANFLKKVPLIIRSLRRIYKTGGYSSLKIAVIHHGEILQGKKILITGGSSGIGLAIAKKCIQEGAHVVITGRNEKKLVQAAEHISSELLHTMVWDVGNTSNLSIHLTEVVNLLGGEIDVLINNAGIIDGTDFPNVTESKWDAVYSVNSRGVFFITQEICKRWLNIERDELKKVINISSQGGFVGATYPYRLTKWDIAGLTQGLGVKLAPHGILVNGIAPGIVATEMQKNLLEDDENVYLPLNPLHRYAIPEEIAELALYLISDASNFIVGQTIVCDGGFSLK